MSAVSETRLLIDSENLFRGFRSGFARAGKKKTQAELARLHETNQKYAQTQIIFGYQSLKKNFNQHDLNTNQDKRIQRLAEAIVSWVKDHNKNTQQISIWSYGKYADPAVELLRTVSEKTLAKKLGIPCVIHHINVEEGKDAAEDKLISEWSERADAEADSVFALGSRDHKVLDFANKLVEERLAKSDSAEPLFILLPALGTLEEASRGKIVPLIPADRVVKISTLYRGYWGDYSRYTEVEQDYLARAKEISQRFNTKNLPFEQAAKAAAEREAEQARTQRRPQANLPVPGKQPAEKNPTTRLNNYLDAVRVIAWQNLSNKHFDSHTWKATLSGNPKGQGNKSRRLITKAIREWLPKITPEETFQLFNEGTWNLNQHGRYLYEAIMLQLFDLGVTGTQQINDMLVDGQLPARFKNSLALVEKTLKAPKSTPVADAGTAEG